MKVVTLKVLAALAILLGGVGFLAFRMKSVADQKAREEAEDAAVGTFKGDPRPADWAKINTFNDRGEWIWADPNWREHFKEQMRELDAEKRLAVKCD